MASGVDYVPPPPPGRRRHARDAVIAILVAAALLAAAKGDSVRAWGQQMEPGVGRGAVLAVGHPVGALADRLPLAEASDELTAWLSSGEEAGGPGGFEADASPAASSGGAEQVSPDSFDPGELGERVDKRPLRKLLVTGDSMTQPMDAELARRLAGSGVEVVRDAHVGTGITKPGFVDWGALSVKQAREERPDAVVVLLGAAEGFPIEVRGGPKVECCGTEYAALYATRVRRMMSTYRRGGRARVYWLTIPEPKDADLAEVTHMVNASLDVASVPWRRHVRVVDLGATLSPGGRFHNSLEVDGREQIVRETDGMHLTRPGAQLAADSVMRALERDFEP